MIQAERLAPYPSSSPRVFLKARLVGYGHFRLRIVGTGVLSRNGGTPKVDSRWPATGAAHSDWIVKRKLRPAQAGNNLRARRDRLLPPGAGLRAAADSEDTRRATLAPTSTPLRAKLAGAHKVLRLGVSSSNLRPSWRRGKAVNGDAA